MTDITITLPRETWVQIVEDLETNEFDRCASEQERNDCIKLRKPIVEAIKQSYETNEPKLYYFDIKYPKTKSEWINTFIEQGMTKEEAEMKFYKCFEHQDFIL